MPSNYPGSLDTHTDRVDNVDEVVAADVNNPMHAAIAIETELGTDVAGSAATLKARLAQSMADDGDLNFADATELTIATGVITITQNWHSVDTEADAASDELATINGGADGYPLIIRPNHTDRSLVIKHGTGNILCMGNGDITLDDSHDLALLIYDSALSKWICAPLIGAAAAGTTNSNISPTTANVSAAVNTRYFADVSGLTANRNFVLPAGAVGDVIELDIKVGDSNVIGTGFALVIIGDTGISINGGSTATAWRKLWLAGDSIKLIADTTSNWQVVEDGRVKPRGLSEASSATPTIDVNNETYHTITALAAAITSMTTNLSGTPVDFQPLTIRIKDNATARAITWGASFEARGVALPTTTVLSKVLTVGFIYDSVSAKWGCVASAQEA